MNRLGFEFGKMNKLVFLGIVLLAVLVTVEPIIPSHTTTFGRDLGFVQPEPICPPLTSLPSTSGPAQNMTHYQIGYVVANGCTFSPEANEWHSALFLLTGYGF